MAAGYAFGPIFRFERADRMRWLIGLGAAVRPASLLCAGILADPPRRRGPAASAALRGRQQRRGILDITRASAKRWCGSNGEVAGQGASSCGARSCCPSVHRDTNDTKSPARDIGTIRKGRSLNPLVNHWRHGHARRNLHAESGSDVAGKQGNHHPEHRSIRSDQFAGGEGDVCSDHAPGLNRTAVYGGLASAEDRSKLIAFLQSPGTN